MDASKHTPGPWKWMMGGIVGVKRDKHDQTVPSVVNHNGLGRQGTETEHNARLIAAAPELLEALDALLNARWQGDQTVLTDAQAKARAAIAKARGEQP